jgi:hypothetical protein
MKHAGSDALDRLEGLLAQVRALGGIKEVKRGVFYRKSKAFLHFHEDPTKGLLADLLHVGIRTRVPVNTAGEQEEFLAEVARRLTAE